MARKHPPDPTQANSMILPLELLSSDGVPGGRYAAQWRDRAQWFRDRGINPGDWSAVCAVLKASWAANGLSSASERARIRLRLTGTP